LGKGFISKKMAEKLQRRRVFAKREKKIRKGKAEPPRDGKIL